MVESKRLIKKDYKDTFVVGSEVSLIEQVINIYETGEVEEVLNYYKEQQGV